jgi:hypothetical protein
VATFDQRGQHVTYQYNAAGDINFAAVSNHEELTQQLKKLNDELRAAREAGALNDDGAADAGYNLERAIDVGKEPGADKSRIARYLEAAKTAISEGTVVVNATAGLIGAFNAAIQVIQRL